MSCPLTYDLDTHEVVRVNASSSSSGSRARYHSASDIIDMLDDDAHRP